MESAYDEMALKEFFIENRQEFEEKLLAEAVNVRDKIDIIHSIGNINLLENAHLLTLYVIEERESEVIEFANQEGKIWAKFSLTLAFKLEWLHAIRRTIWTFLHRFDSIKDNAISKEEFYSLENKINNQIDQFLNCFFMSYSEYKDTLIEKQNRIVEHLSVPIIPVTAKTCVLPLIGPIDSKRANFILEKVLTEISVLKIQTLIFDLSGVAEMEPDVIDQLKRVIDGTVIMGCKAIISGLRPEVVKNMVLLGITFEEASIVASLEQALKSYISG
ncbi:STAS domain-containing protein [Lederbergia panacisoli]|uniref:STAS domain-containing protein n=1 Tax=Lederbergia panacisoli TaxID=1255251 RepID=UPI00214AF784|nr:STAS domain-containing protein [Lederbergia panacisoli]MCR2823831.1 STAS domain-containing protein [Lederbergia panacisoli]